MVPSVFVGAAMRMMQWEWECNGTDASASMGIMGSVHKFCNLNTFGSVWLSLT